MSALLLRNKNPVLADLFRHLCLETTADGRHTLRGELESPSAASFRVARCASEKFHPVLQAVLSPMAYLAFDGMRPLADEAGLGMTTYFVGNQRGC